MPEAARPPGPTPSSSAGCEWSAGRLPLGGGVPPGLRLRPSGAIATTVTDRGARFGQPWLSLHWTAFGALRADGDGAVAAFPLGEGQSSYVCSAYPSAGLTPRTVPPWTRRRPRTGSMRPVALLAAGGRPAVPTAAGKREVVLRSAPAQLEAAHLSADRGDRRRPDDQSAGGHRRVRGTGTTATPRSATPRSRCTPSLRVGFTEEATRFRDWLTARYKERDSHCDGPLQLMYAIDGRSDLTEQVLTHLDGYAGSRPVRIGNAAHGQLQLDIYGELLDAAYLFNKYVAPVGYDGWRHLRELVDWVAGTWGREDEGGLGGARRATALRPTEVHVLGGPGSRPSAGGQAAPSRRTEAAWLKARDAVYEEVMAKGWSEARRSFVQSYGSEALDAATLLMPLTFFMAPNDPQMLATVDEDPGRRPPGAGWPPTGWSTAADSAGRPGRAAGAWRGRSTCAASGWSRLPDAGRAYRPGPPGLKPACCSSRCWVTATTSGCTPSRPRPSGEASGQLPAGASRTRALISAAFNLDPALDADDAVLHGQGPVEFPGLADWTLRRLHGDRLAPRIDRAVSSQ